MPFHPGVPVAKAASAAYARRMVFDAPQGALQTEGGCLKSDLYKKSDGSIGSKAKLKSSKKNLIKYSVLKKAMKKEGVFEKGAFVPVTQDVIDAAKKMQKKK
jgi:hypothetical protein